MAFDTFQKESIARSAFAYIGRYGPGKTDQEIVQLINREYRSKDNSELTTMFNIIRGQRRLGEFGAGVNEAANQNTRVAGTVQDWALVELPGSQVWRVEVTATNQATGDVVRRLVPVSFGASASPADARQAAVEYYQRDQTLGGNYPQRGGVTDQYEITTRIVTVGRNPL